MDLNALLTRMAELEASDLFLKTPSPPAFKIRGEIVTFGDLPVNPQIMEDLVPTTLSPRDQERFTAHNQVDFSYVIPSIGRFRGNCYRQRGSVAIVFRRINSQIPTADSLGLPEILKSLSMERRGLVLVTGSTGSGK